MSGHRIARDLLETHPVSGKPRGLVGTIRRAVGALRSSGVPYSVIGAAALAARGLPRMTADLAVTVMLEDAPRAVAALKRDGFSPASPPGPHDAPEAMIVFVDPVSRAEVDLLSASGDPEATVIEEAPETMLFGISARVATLEHLLLLYLYSNQPRHLGDFAAIVQSGEADLGGAERALALMHPEMLDTWRERVEKARSPAAPPPRPPTRRRR